MARIAKLDLNQLNTQLDKIEALNRRVSELESSMQSVSFQTSQLDYIHARPTFNNLVFTWTGASGTLSWAAGWIKDKNAATDTGDSFSRSPSYGFSIGKPFGATHNVPVPAGSIPGLAASTYYWVGWDVTNAAMTALTDITKLYSHHDMQVVCQVFTGTAGQTGTAGGGGAQGGTDLSGARYKLF